jgi:flagellar biosynthesis protein FliR
MGIFNTINGFSLLQFQGFILVMFRIAGLFFDAPVFSNRNIPAIVRVGFVLFLSLIILPLVPLENVAKASDGLLFVFAIIKEALIGMVLGFFARLIFLGIQIAGQIIDYQMGLGFVNIVDPESQLQVPIIGQFLYIIVLFVFLLINGHHWIVQALVKSFDIVPLAAAHFKPVLVQHVVRLFSDTFVMGFKIAAPIGMSLFLVDLAYGVIARALPQANIMVVGFPIKIGLGFIFLLTSMPLFFMVMKRFMVSSLTNLNALFRMM